MGSEKSGVEVAFGPGEADRRVAGVAAAARVARDLAQRGATHLTLAVPERALAPTTVEDLRRLAPELAFALVDRPGPAAIAAPRLDTAAILRSTAKPSDGLVSRWLNRPVSRFLSAQLLRFPAIRPLHASLGTAFLAAAMILALVYGGRTGLIAGGLLFHAASVFDGVDGEIARATFRTSRLGALLDTVIDMATNLLFLLGVTVNLAARSSLAAPVGGWALLLILIGFAAISLSAARDDRPFTMDVVKHRYRARFPDSASGGLIRFLTVITSRDFFAFVCAILILIGVPMAVLYCFAVSATVWILFVFGALIVPPPATSAEGSA